MTFTLTYNKFASRWDWKIVSSDQIHVGSGTALTFQTLLTSFMANEKAQRESEAPISSHQTFSNSPASREFILNQTKESN